MNVPYRRIETKREPYVHQVWALYIDGDRKQLVEIT